MTIETAKTTTEPKNPASTTATATHGCCGGEAAAKSPKNISERVDHHAHPVPSKAATSSCCCGTTKESDPADRKNRSAVSE